MQNAARQFIFSARECGAPEGFNRRSLQAYYKAIEARKLRSSTIEIQFSALHRLAYLVGEEPDTLKMISDVVNRRWPVVRTLHCSIFQDSRFTRLQHSCWSEVGCAQ